MVVVIAPVEVVVVVSSVNSVLALIAANRILAGASLAATNLENAYLYRTNLEGVDLSRATGLTEVQLRGSCGNTETRLPSGLAPPPDWPCASE